MLVVINLAELSSSQLLTRVELARTCRFKLRLTTATTLPSWPPYLSYPSAHQRKVCFSSVRLGFAGTIEASLNNGDVLDGYRKWVVHEHWGRGAGLGYRGGFFTCRIEEEEEGDWRVNVKLLQ